MAKRFFVQLGCGLISRCQSGSYETEPAKKARKTKKGKERHLESEAMNILKYLEILSLKYVILTLLAFQARLEFLSVQVKNTTNFQAIPKYFKIKIRKKVKVET
jgi:hypothetical protein